jgi:hypothetical protein
MCHRISCNAGSVTPPSDGVRDKACQRLEQLQTLGHVLAQ